jgi:hypothetical protein
MKFAVFRKIAGKALQVTKVNPIDPANSFFGGAERDRTADLLVAKMLRDEFSNT